MRGRYRGGRSRGGYSGERRWEGRGGQGGQGRQGYQRGYPESGGWGDEREWEMGGSMGGYQGMGEEFDDSFSRPGSGMYGRGSHGGSQPSGRQYGGAEYGGQRGPYSGRGPKGYQRSDERIREDVSEALSRHGHIDASEITVEVRGGEVTLTGTVDSREAKREAERAIENESGVREVQNRLRVQERKADSQSQGGESATSQRSGVPSADQQAESRGRSRSSSAVGANV